MTPMQNAADVSLVEIAKTALETCITPTPLGTVIGMLAVIGMVFATGQVPTIGGVRKKGQIMAAVWELDQPVGEVLVTYADGSRYEGGWKMRSGREGIGTYFLPDNTHWLAEWSGDQKQGYGILYDSSGRILQESYFHSERG